MFHKKLFVAAIVSLIVIDTASAMTIADCLDNLADMVRDKIGLQKYCECYAPEMTRLTRNEAIASRPNWEAVALATQAADNKCRPLIGGPIAAPATKR